MMFDAVAERDADDADNDVARHDPSRHIRAVIMVERYYSEELRYSGEQQRAQFAARYDVADDADRYGAMMRVDAASAKMRADTTAPLRDAHILVLCFSRR